MNSQILNIASTDVFGFTNRNWNTILSILRQYASVKKVMLFGSRAVGTYKPYSDIDLAIINTDFNQQDYPSLVNAFEESDLPFFTDILVFHRLQNEDLKAQIMQNGKVIYEQ